MPPRLIPNFVNKTYFHRKTETTLEVNSSMNENRKYSSNPNTGHPITRNIGLHEDLEKSFFKDQSRNFEVGQKRPF